MKIEQVKLTQIKTNAENPRQIGKIKFQKLIDSLLVFPAMMEIRPIVIDGVMAAIGGNQRLAALRAIAKMEVEEIAQRILRSPEYQERTEAEKKRLVDFWEEWRQKPTAYIIDAKTLTAAERRQFIIKDNVSYGQWDYDALANKWDNDRLEAMGLDVWTMPATDFSATASPPSNDKPEPRKATPGDNDIDEVSPNEFGDTFSLPEGERSPFQQMTFTFADSQSEFIRKTLKGIPDNEISEEDKSGNANGNGNRIYKIVKEWAEQRK